MSKQSYEDAARQQRIELYKSTTPGQRIRLAVELYVTGEALKDAATKAKQASLLKTSRPDRT